MNDSEPRDCLGVFAKYWEPGKVKTRLAQSIGATKAARVYEGLVAATLARLATFDCRRVLAYSPADERTLAAFTAAKEGGWSLCPQTDGHLGQRMTHFFEEQFQGGAERVVLLGTDSPNVPLVEVQEAFEHLKTRDVVIGPTDDGGYYLIGAANTVPPIFEDIPWSTSEVLPETRRRLDSAGILYDTLDPWYDIDEMFDLHRLVENLQDECESEPALVVLRDHVVKVLEE